MLSKSLFLLGIALIASTSFANMTIRKGTNSGSSISNELVRTIQKQDHCPRQEDVYAKMNLSKVGSGWQVGLSNYVKDTIFSQFQGCSHASGTGVNCYYQPVSGPAGMQFNVYKANPSGYSCTCDKESGAISCTKK